MYKWIIASVAIVALSAFIVFDYLSFTHQDEVEVASLADDHGLAVAHLNALGAPPAEKGSYLNHLLSKVGLGKKPPLTEAGLRHARQALRDAPLNSFLPTPDAEEDVLAEWERLEWDDSYQAAFGWPDRIDATTGKTERDAHKAASALYLKGGSSVYVTIEFAEPTEKLATRLKQSYWVVETGRDLERLREGRPRASYFWTNIKETSYGRSVKYAKDVAFFESFEGVHFLKAKNKKDRRDVETKYYFASLGSGVVIKVRALASKKKVKEILAGIDYQSLNQMQTLPSPLIAEGLADILLDTPQNWLGSHGFASEDVSDVADKTQHGAPKIAKH